MAAVASRREVQTVALEADAYQRAFLRSRAPTVLYQGGAGSGKTYVGVLSQILKRVSIPGSRGMYVSPSHPQMTHSARPYFEELGASLGIEWQWNKTDKVIEFRNGSREFLRSADKPESILGADVADAHGDEVALWHPDALRHLSTRVRTKGFANQLTLGLTPKGRNWLWEYYFGPSEQAKKRRHPSALHVLHHRSASRAFLDDEYAARMAVNFGKGSSWWLQEALGDFVAFSGLVYSFDAGQHLVPYQSANDIRKAHKWRGFLGAVDWGFADPMCILVAGVTEEGVVIVLEEWYQHRVTPEQYLPVMKEYQARYGINHWLCDPSGAGQIAGCRAAGLNGVVGAFNSIAPGIAVVEGRLRSGRLLLSASCPHTVAEFGQYAYPTDSEGNPKRDTPIDAVNHCMDTLRYLVTGVDGTGQDADPQNRVYTAGEVMPGFRPIRVGW